MARLGGLSRQRRGRPLNAEVNIINLVDVMLVLLVIFMVTAPILQGGIAVNLPKLDTAPVAVKDPLIITVEKNGTVSIGEQRLRASDVEQRIALVAAQTHPGGVMFRADGGASWDDITRVLGIMNRHGLEKVNMVTQPTNKP